MLIQIDDDVARKYLLAAEQARIPVEKLLSRQLAKFADLPVGIRSLVLSGDDLQTVDQLLGIGSTRDSASLLAAIRAWAGITLGDIRLAFSPAQLQELALRAEKQGKTPEALVDDMVQQICRDLFYAPVGAR